MALAWAVGAVGDGSAKIAGAHTTVPHNSLMFAGGPYPRRSPPSIPFLGGIRPFSNGVESEHTVGTRSTSTQNVLGPPPAWIAESRNKGDG